MIFNISNQLKLDIYSILYDRNTLRSMINFHKQNPTKHKVSQPHPNWRDKKEIIEWLLNKDLFNKLSIEIEYDKIEGFLRLKRIQVIHNLYNNQQTLFELPSETNQEDAYILNLPELDNISRSLEGFFKFNVLKKLPMKTTYHLRRSLLIKSDKDTVKQHMPILIPIFDSLFNDFFNVIHVIPAKRIFDSDSDRDNISNLTLDLNGKNLVKFIHKKAAKQKGGWLKEWNQDLKHFLEDIEQLKQVIKRNERSILILKEYGLNMDIPLESMGSGILNIAHFLAYIKTLKNPSVICIEEPEIHLHPGLERELRNEFIRKSKKHQIFITTHSREFLDDNEEKCSIYLINKSKDSSIVKKVSNEDYKEIYRDLEFNLSHYKKSNKILTDKEFWKRFIVKAMSEEKYENELWDFKQFLEIWKATDPEVKKEKKINFCGHVGAFANNRGGVLILGISDKTLREIKGLNDVETKMNQLNELILKFTDYPRDFFYITSISLMDNNNIKKDCIIIAIAQTQEAVAVKDHNDRYYYYYRITSGKQKRAPREISNLKKEVVRDNYKFLNNIREQFNI
jgi:hypothetical protein